jgi:hypothetical protein
LILLHKEKIGSTYKFLPIREPLSNSRRRRQLWRKTSMERWCGYCYATKIGQAPAPGGEN